MDIVTLAASRKYTDKKIAESAAVGIKYEIVDSLPSSGEAQTIYFVKNDSSWINNYYDEYVWISSSGSFEKIGSTQLDDFIQNPSAAEVGQTIVVKEVNEEGKPIAWEMADLPEQVQVDATLTQSGQSADAAVVGQRLGELSEEIVKPVAKTSDMTQPVGVDENGQLWVAPIGSSSGGGSETVSHGIVWDLTHVTSSSSAVSIGDGSALSAVLTADEGYTLGDVTVAMGGTDITATAWDAETSKVTIASVTGDVVITCAGVAQVSADTSPVIAQENMAYQTSSGSILATLSARAGMCITKPYTFSSMVESYREAGIYDEETGTVTNTNYCPRVNYYIPNTKYLENAEANGYSTSGISRYFKIAHLEDDTIVGYGSNGSYANSVVATGMVYNGGFSNSARANAIAFTLTIDDAEDSYAYWTQVGSSEITSLLPDGVRSGDIIFAGKNSPYYGMANIDGTLAGAEPVSELSLDDDIAQNYSVAAVSILGDETAADTSTEYGISSDLAAAIDAARSAWMMEYGGDYRKIPLIITTDQHGRTNPGIWKMLGKVLSMYDVSKIMNLGDTVSVEWYDEDTAHPLISCAQLEMWCESIKAIPFSKRLDVYGNHDTWYGNYADEGNAIGTRYPGSQAHLYQYFRNIYARRTTNNGWFAVCDDMFNVKYMVVSGFEYQGVSTFRIGTKQMDWMIDEMGKDDGYDIVIVSHVPLYYQDSTNVWPTGMVSSTPDSTEIMRVAAIDTDALFNARKNRTAGTVTDSDGVEHTFDFTNCSTDILCGLHGHVHIDGYNYVGGMENGLMNAAFDWFDENTLHFVLIDRVNRQLNVWKLEGDGLACQNYQIPLDKPTE